MICDASLDLGSYVPQDCPKIVTTGLLFAFCSRLLIVFVILGLFV